MNITPTLRHLAVAALLSFGLAVHAADPKPTVKHADKTFIEKAAKSGMEEAEVSEAALPHLMNAEAKAFAQMMVTDHTGANTELKALAMQKGVALPAKQPDTDKWQKKKTGKDYDEDYIEKMIEDHNDAVDLFTKAAKDAEDIDVRAFAAKTLPTLQAHQVKAKEIKKGLK